MEVKSNQIKRTLKDPFTAAQIFLRISAAVATVAAASFMITDGENVVVFGVNIDIKYSLDPTFKFFVYENIIACGFSLLTLMLTLIIAFTSFDPTVCYFFVFLHDMIVTILLTGGVAATAAIGNMGNTGRKSKGRIAVPVGMCRYTPKLCNRGEMAVLLSFAGMFMYLILTIMSANKSRRL